MMHHCNRCESTEQEMHEIGPASFVNTCKSCGYRWTIKGKQRALVNEIADLILLILVILIMAFAAKMYFRGNDTPPPPNGWFGTEKHHGLGKG